jgi:hypothetical protein
MESFLNFLWVVLALAALYLWRVRWARQARETDHAAWRQWTAFVCALVLLFFFVSITDDLHSELVIFEESSASLRHAGCVACPHHAPAAHSAGATLAVLGGTDFVPVFTSTELLTAEADFQIAQEIPKSLAGRAPPEFSL